MHVYVYSSSGEKDGDARALARGKSEIILSRPRRLPFPIETRINTEAALAAVRVSLPVCIYIYTVCDIIRAGRCGAAGGPHARERLDGRMTGGPFRRLLHLHPPLPRRCVRVRRREQGDLYQQQQPLACRYLSHSLSARPKVYCKRGHLHLCDL